MEQIMKEIIIVSDVNDTSKASIFRQFSSAEEEDERSTCEIRIEGDRFFGTPRTD